MKNKKKTLAIMVMVLLFCVVMAVVDGVTQANYFIKSAIKLGVFLVLPVIYALFDKEWKMKTLFIMNRQGMTLALGLCIPLYVVIVGGYLLLKDVFDFSAITGTLTANIGVHRNNFIWVSLYISLVNSLLEEFFFRGIAFLSLRRVASNRFAYLFSATVFALYHVAMMIGWFSAELFTIVLAGLFIGGGVFNYLDAKSGSVYPSWFVHMFANFAINTIGFMLFGIIPGI